MKSTIEEHEAAIQDVLNKREQTVLLQRSYHEAPYDILEMIVLMFSDVGTLGYGVGGMNVLRMVSKRLVRMVESCATRLTNGQIDGPNTLPLVLRRCPRIEHIRCDSHNLRSLEGCPVGLQSLDIMGNVLQSLEPLRRCSKMRILVIWIAQHNSDITPLTSCTKITKLLIGGCPVLDLTPLLTMPFLEDLVIAGCRQIRSLAPLAGLRNLQVLDCQFIDRQTSVLPLESCFNLKHLNCFSAAKDLDELKKRRPGLKVNESYFDIKS